MYAQLMISPDGGEQLEYNFPDFSVRCVDGDLSSFFHYSAGCHWHNDFEILLANEGDIQYFVNGRIVTIKQGQAIFVNANRLHYGFSAMEQECLYICLVFHPNVFGADPSPAARYIRQFSQDDQPDYLLLTDSAAISRIRRIYDLCREHPDWCEISVLANCCELVQQLHRKMITQDAQTDPDGDWLALRQMTGYLQTNYTQRIRLEDIAAAGAVCRSKCCRLFREKLDTTPLEYLNRYRMEKARELLLSSGKTITETARQCGFDNPSYFSELFRKIYGISPRELRSSNSRKSER